MASREFNTDIAVLGNISATNVTATLLGNATTSSSWKTARTLTLGGDLTGSVSIKGNANISLSASIKATALDARYVRKVGDTMSGPLVLSGAIMVSTFSSDKWTMKNVYTGGSWARAIIDFTNSSGTKYYEVAAYGSGQTYKYGYIGTAYNTPAIKWYPDNHVAIGGINTATSPNETLLVTGDSRVTDKSYATTFIGALTGNASSANVATKLETARNLKVELSNDITGTANANFDGSGDWDITIPTTVASIGGILPTDIVTKSGDQTLTGEKTFSNAWTRFTGSYVNISNTLMVGSIAGNAVYRSAGSPGTSPTLSLRGKDSASGLKDVFKITPVLTTATAGSEVVKVTVASLGKSIVEFNATASAAGQTSFKTNVSAPAFVGSLSGNAASASKAARWTTARTITLSGDASGSVSIDGTANKTLAVSVGNNSHQHNYIAVTDDRDMKPSVTNKGYLKPFFTSLEGMTGSAGANYQDVVVLNSYHDSSGGNINAIAFDKSEMKVRVFHAAQSASTWGTPKVLPLLPDGGGSTTKYLNEAGGFTTPPDTSYSHPGHTARDLNVDTGALTGAVIVSDIDIRVTSDALGHVTRAEGFLDTRTLTLSDLGYTGASDANYYGDWNLYVDGAHRNITNAADVKFKHGTGVSLSVVGDEITINNTAVNVPAKNSTITINAGTHLSGGGTFTLDQSTAKTITINNTSPNVSANDATITLSAGGAMTGGGSFTTDQASNETITFNHADTSSQGSVNNSGATVVQDVTLDGYGHVTGLGSTTLSAASLGIGWKFEGQTNLQPHLSATTRYQMAVIDGNNWEVRMRGRGTVSTTEQSVSLLFSCIDGEVSWMFLGKDSYSTGHLSAYWSIYRISEGKFGIDVETYAGTNRSSQYLIWSNQTAGLKPTNVVVNSAFGTASTGSRVINLYYPFYLVSMPSTLSGSVTGSAGSTAALTSTGSNHYDFLPDDTSYYGNVRLSNYNVDYNYWLSASHPTTGTDRRDMLFIKGNTQGSHAGINVLSFDKDMAGDIQLWQANKGDTHYIVKGALALMDNSGTYGQIISKGGWLRTPASGLLPDSNGGAALGTSSWKFSTAYITTIYGALSGNASTATELKTARNIKVTLSSGASGTGNIDFDGSKDVNITVPVTVAGSSHGHVNVSKAAAGFAPIIPSAATSNYVLNGAGSWVNATGLTTNYSYKSAYVIPVHKTPTAAYGDMGYGRGVYKDFAGGSSTTPVSAVMLGNGTTISALIGDGVGNVYLGYANKTAASFNIRTILTSANYNSYAPSKTGTGASGTWGISINGNAATATKLASIATTFSGTYPLTTNVSGTIYSHTGITFTGSSNTLTTTNVNATTFTGALTGIASKVALNTSGGGATMWYDVPIISGNKLYKASASDKKLTFNLSTGDLKAISFHGRLYGSLSGSADYAYRLSPLSEAYSKPSHMSWDTRLMVYQTTYDYLTSETYGGDKFSFMAIKNTTISEKVIGIGFNKISGNAHIFNANVGSTSWTDKGEIATQSWIAASGVAYGVKLHTRTENADRPIPFSYSNYLYKTSTAGSGLTYNPGSGLVKMKQLKVGAYPSTISGDGTYLQLGAKVKASTFYGRFSGLADYCYGQYLNRQSYIKPNNGSYAGMTIWGSVSDAATVTTSTSSIFAGKSWSVMFPKDRAGSRHTAIAFANDDSRNPRIWRATELDAEWTDMGEIATTGGTISYSNYWNSGTGTRAANYTGVNTRMSHHEIAEKDITGGTVTDRLHVVRPHTTSTGSKLTSLAFNTTKGHASIYQATYGDTNWTKKGDLFESIDATYDSMRSNKSGMAMRTKEGAWIGAKSHNGSSTSVDLKASGSMWDYISQTYKYGHFDNPGSDKHVGNESYPWLYMYAKSLYLTKAAGTPGTLINGITDGISINSRNNSTKVNIEGSSSQGGSAFLRVGAPSGISGGMAFYNYYSRIAFIRTTSGSTSDVFYYSASSSNVTFTGSITASGNITANSDLRLKDDLKPIDSRGIISNLTCYNYRRKDLDIRQYGIIAQDVEEVMPEAIMEADDKMKTKSIAYNQVVSVLVEDNKRLQSELDKVNERMDKLEKLIKTLL